LSFRDVEEMLAVRGVPSDMSRSENGVSGVPWIRMGMSWIFWMFCPEPEGQEGGKDVFPQAIDKGSG